MPRRAYSGEEHLELWRWKLAERSFVYVIRPSHDTAIKVGFAKDVKARLRELQTGNPRRLNLMYVLPGDRKLESGLHWCLDGTARLGEWFDGPAVDAFVEAVADLADAMVAGHDKNGELPDVYVLARDILPTLLPPDPPPTTRKSKIASPVQIDYQAPSVSKEERQRRLEEHWLRPSRIAAVRDRTHEGGTIN